MCKIAFSKKTDNVKKRGCMIFLWSGCVIFLTTVTTLTAVTNVFFFTFSTLLERAILHILQPMWCSQGSVLRFLQCFFIYMIFGVFSGSKQMCFLDVHKWELILLNNNNAFLCHSFSLNDNKCIFYDFWKHLKNIFKKSFNVLN